MIPIGTQYQNIRQLRDDLEELLTPELGIFPNGLRGIWVEDSQSRSVSDGVSVILQEDMAMTQTVGKFSHQNSTSGEWVVVLRSFGSPEQFRIAKEKMRALPQSMREMSLPFVEGIIPQTTFRIAATINRNTWQ